MSLSTARAAQPLGVSPLEPGTPTVSPRAPTKPALGPSVDSSNLSYVETLYNEYLRDPSTVPREWHEYFAQLALAAAQGGDTVAPSSFFHAPPIGDGTVVPPYQLEAAILQERVDHLIRNYRLLGHYAAAIDPLGQPRPDVPELDPEFIGFQMPSDLDRQCSTLISSGPNVRTIREILTWLRNTYCRSIGVQFMHIDEMGVREWLQERMEATENRIELTIEQQKRILKRLSEATLFEEFILKRFQGAKSFSLEGGETLIPLLEQAINKAATHGVNEVVLGMAHRGRLNVLTSIMGKSARAIFREFADLDPELNIGRGDVKYHLGYSSDWLAPTGAKVHLSLCFNPSHLEFVNTVAMGRVRAKQDRKGDKDHANTMCILIHGDAAFAGEGVIQESLNMSNLEATRIGGTVHVIVNNQVGFTTGPGQGRSTSYASDVAKMLQIPIFHVNGEDPEAVAQVVELAMDFRNEFHQDVMIDMYCYRKRGHNEQDEPRFTQPEMYKVIDSLAPVRESYFRHLSKLNGVTQDEADAIVSSHRETLEAEYRLATSPDYVHNWNVMRGFWHGYAGGPEASVQDVPTGLPAETLQPLLEVQTVMPLGFTPNAKLDKNVINARREMAQGKRPLDWAAGEALAFSSLVVAGHRVRLHGQDVERGTFGHRHAVLHDSQTNECYTPLQHVAPDQAPFDIYNSCLCEAGVLGFEYGYSLDYPDGLVIWEAQFGDFVNVAQVIIDQFISSAEDKWSRLSALVMLLPHGFEGNGPEHSSARLERFLNLCAEDNMQVAYPTTSAQLFHLLRRQVLRKWRKPLVVMTPKAYLRSPLASCPLEDFAKPGFEKVIPDTLQGEGKDVKSVLLCSGKVYFDLAKRREELGRHDVAILRIEQLYPLPTKELAAELGRYGPNVPVAWVQEEPENMGAWWFILAHWGRSLLAQRNLKVVSRPASASPATGSHHSHDIEQKALVEEAFAQS